LVASIVYALHLYRVSQIKKVYSVRTQISRDLHDDIGASLSSINIYSTVAESEVGSNPGKAKEILRKINANSRQVMENIGDIVWANRISRTDDSTLAGRIKNYGYDLLSQKNIECVYNVDPALDKRLTNPETRKNILLLIKEALNNIAKYSKATSTEVSVFLNGAQVQILIRDNGVGFDSQKPRAGNGLMHMRQRAEATGGRLEIDSVQGAGTRITASIPIASISDV
jgi:signal transduction histidine kinase